MEEQISASQIPVTTPPQPAVAPQMPQMPPAFSLEQIEEMKARARELAIQQTMAQQSLVQQNPPMQPKVVYVRRNLTVAEILVCFIVSCGVVLGIQGSWYLASNFLPRVEIKVK